MKFFRIAGSTLLAVAAVIIGVGPDVSAQPQIDPPYKVVVWEMPSWSGDRTPVFPQKLAFAAGAWDIDGALGIPNEPECGYFQIDVYDYVTEDDRAAVDHLLEVGVLKGPNNPHEPLVKGGYGVAYTLVNAGECITETPTPTPTETTETPTPTPTESSETPTPTPTPTETVPVETPSTSTPPATPSKTCTSNCGLADTGGTTSPLLGAGLLALLAGGILVAAARRKGTHL